VDDLLRELLRTTREARGGVHAELELLLRADLLNVYALRQLQGSAAEFAGQAESLARMMQSLGAEEALIGQVEELCEFFEVIADQVASLLGGGPVHYWPDDAL
jgi:hypothetical protein